MLGMTSLEPAAWINNAIPANYERDFFDVGGSSPAYNPGVANANTAPVPFVPLNVAEAHKRC